MSNAIGSGRVGRFTSAAACLVLALAAAPAAASQVSLVSRAEPTLPNEAAGGETTVSGPRISADGRYVVFVSRGPNLVPGQTDTNRALDIFLRDRVAGTTVLVSRSAASPTTPANGDSDSPVLSADGRYVAFLSMATDLVAGQVDGNDVWDLFLFDRVTGTVSLVSRTPGSPVTTANASAMGAFSLSADGAYLAHYSLANDLVAGQSGTGGQVYLYDRAAGTNRLVSHAAGSTTAGASSGAGNPSISADGQWVAYESFSSDLVAGSTVPTTAIFVFDRATGANVLASHSSGSSTQGGNGASMISRISADGLWVAFSSVATDLLPGVTGTDSRDVFLWERQTGAITLATRDASSATTEIGVSSLVHGISADGNEVLLTSWIPQNTAGLPHLYLFQRTAGVLTLVNHIPGSPSTPGDATVVRASLSADGDFVVFESVATNLLSGPADADFDEDVFLFDRSTGEVSLISRVAGTTATYPPGRSRRPEISGGGGHVVFTSAESLTTAAHDFNDRDDVYVHERAAGTADLVSRLADASATAGGSFQDHDAEMPTIASADGRWVVFASIAPNLVPGQVEDEAYPTGTSDVFLRDRATGTTVLVSRKAGATPATGATGGSFNPQISADGRWVAFESSAPDLAAGQSGPVTWLFNIFLFDRDTGDVTLLSHAAGSPTTAANESSELLGLSADGSRVLFSSLATDLGATDGNAAPDLYLYDRGTGAVTLVSHAAGAATTAGNGGSLLGGRLSADGAFVVFTSAATNLVAGQTDANGKDDVFLYDAGTGTTTLVSHVPGSATTAAGDGSSQPTVSADGALVAFASRATDLEAGLLKVHPGDDVYRFTRATGAVSLVSRSAISATTTGGGASSRPVLSADGAWLAFESYAGDLVPGLSDPFGGDIFLHQLATGQTRLVSHAPGSPMTAVGSSPGIRGISGDGRLVVFISTATGMVWHFQGVNDDFHAFLYDRETGENILVSRSLASPVQTATSPINSATTVAGAFLSADGGTVLFTSTADDLVAGDVNFNWDLFAYDNGRLGYFYTLFPCRLFDSRRPQDGPALTSNVSTVLHLFNVCGIPETAKSLAVNVTVVQPTAGGHLTLYRGEMTTLPATSTINFGAGQIRANNAILRLAASAEGTLRIRPVLDGGGTVHVLVDVVGYFE